MCEEGGALHAEKIHSNPENSYRCCQRQEYAFAECVCELLGTLYVRSGHGALLPVALFFAGCFTTYPGNKETHFECVCLRCTHSKYHLLHCFWVDS